MLNRNRLYTLLLLLCAASSGWVVYLFFSSYRQISAVFCPAQWLYNIPCPSCGTTRAVILIMEGNLKGALLSNPLGFAAFFMLIILPVWIFTDLFQKSDSLYRTFQQSERILVNHKWIAALLVIFIIANWIWNITKGL